MRYLYLLALLSTGCGSGREDRGVPPREPVGDVGVVILERLTPEGALVRRMIDDDQGRAQVGKWLSKVSEKPRKTEPPEKPEGFLFIYPGQDPRVSPSRRLGLHMQMKFVAETPVETEDFKDLFKIFEELGKAAPPEYSRH
jgi:hypothetical protein